MPAKILTFKSAKATISGLTFPISSARIHLSLNAIPSIVITSPPLSQNTDLLKKPATINDPSLSDIKQILSQLQGFILQESPVSVEIEVESSSQDSGGIKYPQKLSLSNWILVSAGCGDVTSTGAFPVSCTIMHPSCKLATHGGYYGNLKEEPSINAAAGAGDPLDLLKKTLSSYAEADRDELSYMKVSNLPYAADPKSKMQEVMDKAVETLGKSLTWDSLGHSNSIPFMTGLSGSEIKQQDVAVGCAYAILGSNLSSNWDILLGTVCPQFGLAVLPTYTKETLQLSPFFPWQAPKISVTSQMIYSVRFPTTTPTSIMGVKISAANKRVPDLSTEVNGTNKVNEDSPEKKTGSDFVYIPSSAVSDLFGQIVHVDTPPVVNAIISTASGAVQSLVAGAISTEAPNKSGDGNIDDAISDINMLAMTYASYVFISRYKCSDETVITCPIMFKVGGTSIEPGVSLALCSETGTVILEGFISEVVHDLTMHGATTSIKLSYCRDAGGQNSVVADDTKNPIYSAS